MPNVGFDNNLNEAGWEMIEALAEHGPLSSDQFNHMKTILRGVIEAYLERAKSRNTKNEDAT